VTASIATAPAKTAGAPVPFVRLDNANPALFAELMGAVESIASRAAFTLGTEVEAFEKEFAEYCSTERCVSVSSGTEALVLALRGLGVGPGDEVIVPANSFIATSEAVSLTGATPKLVDVDPVTCHLTAAHVADAIGPNTKAVIPVHLYGATVDIDPILAVARDAGIAVVEDACQAHGARIGRRRAGGVAHVGCFSFYPTKNLGAWGDGGAITTNDLDLAERIRLLRAHGEDPRRRYHHKMPGTTARLDALQAAVLRIKLRHLDEWTAARRTHAAHLTAALAGTGLELPVIPEGGDHVYHLYVVRTDRRDELKAALADQSVASAIHYPIPIHRTEAYAGLGTPTLPVTERLADTILSLPMWPGMEDGELDRIVEAVERALS
jgi:dTDP-3-amino-3,4,6-trideoxy-alpha-D-glucose transaminase